MNNTSKRKEELSVPEAEKILAYLSAPGIANLVRTIAGLLIESAGRGRKEKALMRKEAADLTVRFCATDERRKALTVLLNRYIKELNERKAGGGYGK